MWWHWEVTFKDRCGQIDTLRSTEGYATMALAFGAYLEDTIAISDYLKKLKCQLILREEIVFDNERVFEEDEDDNS